MVKGSVVVVAGHGIYVDGRWYGGFQGEDDFYVRHVKAGVSLLKDGPYDFCVLIGGATRPELAAETKGVSEAKGMKMCAVDNRFFEADDGRILLEEFARDSMENLLFSILEFHRKTGNWPGRIGVVSWNSKALRYHLIASGMQLGGRIFFHGVGDYPAQADLERACAAEARFNAAIVDVTLSPPGYNIVDPLLRSPLGFAQKRWGRMPSRFAADTVGNRKYMEEVKSAYAVEDETVRTLLEQIENLQPGNGWRHIEWPWL